MTIIEEIEKFANGETLFDGHYRLLRPLEKADGSANVWLALDVNTIDNYYSQYGNNNYVIDESSGLQVAIKFIRLEKALDDETEQRLLNEYNTIQKCPHANLLQPIGFSVFMGQPYFVFPYCESGSAEKLVGEKMSNATLWKFISDVASGLDALHTNKLAHQNVTPSNILIDGNGNFVLTDFGITGILGCNNDENSMAFSNKAPECTKANSELSAENDIWAFGATLCEMLTGSLPFGNEGGKAQARGNGSLPELKEASSSVRNLILACLQSNPAKRPSARQIMDAAQKKRFPIKQKTTKPVIVALVSILIISGIIVFSVIKGKHTDNSIVEEKVNYYEKAVELLTETATAQNGFHILDSLVSENDFQATFLMSRLYFEPMNDRDAASYNSIWKDMRINADISSDNQKAHEFLFRAFSLNQDDCVTLYELGCDYMAPDWQRGSEKNLNYAKWCFLQANAVAKGLQDANSQRYLEKIDDLASRISNHETQNDTVIQPIIPQR